MKNSGKKAVYITAFVIVFLLSIIYKLFIAGDLSLPWITDNDLIENSILETNADVEEMSDSTAEGGTISIYICGAVTNPGVYEVEKDSILNDVVLLAGGLKDQAASERIDLVYVLSENVSIYIPTLDEVHSGLYNGIVFISGSEQESFSPISEPNQSSSGGLVNINTASLEELQTLPGVGQATARAIISYRENNPFTEIEDIMNVPGIGEGKFNQLSGFICV